MDPGQFVRLWEQLRPKFSPVLLPGIQIAQNLRDQLLLSTLQVDCILQGAQMEPGILARRWQLNRISHGPFAKHEMEFLLRYHRDLIEVGCGSGKFGHDFVRGGGNILCHDNNAYGFTEGFPWTTELAEQG